MPASPHHSVPQIQSLISNFVGQVVNSLQDLTNSTVPANSLSPFHLSFYRATLPVLIQRLEMLPARQAQRDDRQTQIDFQGCTALPP